jgi:hypothetical protein
MFADFFISAAHHIPRVGTENYSILPGTTLPLHSQNLSTHQN